MHYDASIATAKNQESSQLEPNVAKRELDPHLKHQGVNTLTGLGLTNLLALLVLMWCINVSTLNLIFRRKHDIFTWIITQLKGEQLVDLHLQTENPSCLETSHPR